MKILKLMVIVALVGCASSVLAVTQQDIQVLQALNKSAQTFASQGKRAETLAITKDVQKKAEKLMDDDTASDDQIDALSNLHSEALKIQMSLGSSF